MTPVKFKIRHALYTLIFAATAGQAFISQARADTCTQMSVPSQGAFGSDGPYSWRTDNTVPSPQWAGHNVTVYIPKLSNASQKAPVIFYSHAYGATDPNTTINLFKNLASRGYIVVFSPYDSASSTADIRYSMLWGGFDAAVRKFGNLMDLSKVGYVGWSFGGGATPAMAYKGITTKGWGSAKAFMYIMAPWYSYQISSGDLANFPKHVNLVMQVFDQDATNDHRMAIDIFGHIGIPSQQKNFLTAYNENQPGCAIVADHSTPSDNGATPLPMRIQSIYRLLDALAAYTFDGNRQAAQVALGNGSSAQTSMGAWGNRMPLTPLSETSNPIATHPESNYQFPWSNRQNPRL